jgi:hypothetical protein
VLLPRSRAYPRSSRYWRAGMSMQHSLHQVISAISAKDASTAFHLPCATSLTSAPGKAA